jgi:membrane-associated HD superfamily phosphohydrolase
MSSLPNVEQNNEQILGDIQSLQQTEQQLFNSLETNPNLSKDQQQKIVEKMNQISNMRINLYKTLSGINSFYKSALSSSVGTLQEQVIAVGIVEDELNRSKKRLEILQEERNNKIRLVEINDYYSDTYAEHSQLMKIIIFTLIPIIILGVLNNKGILPDLFYRILLIIVAFIGAYYFWECFGSIIMRDNMNYQEYNWFFNATSAPGPPSSTSTSDPWNVNLPPMGTCIGQMCCSTGQTWSSSLAQCVGASTVRV